MVPTQWLGAKLELQPHYFKRNVVHSILHCYGHALNLAVQDTVESNRILKDTLDTVEEMTKFIKKSPKWETIFKIFKDDVSCDSPGIRLLCPTRWTVCVQLL